MALSISLLGSLAINRASIAQAQAWMGHVDIKTTMRYRHHKSEQCEWPAVRLDDAELHGIDPPSRQDSEGWLAKCYRRFHRLDNANTDDHNESANSG